MKLRVFTQNMAMVPICPPVKQPKLRGQWLAHHLHDRGVHLALLTEMFSCATRTFKAEAQALGFEVLGPFDGRGGLTNSGVMLVADTQVLELRNPAFFTYSRAACTDRLASKGVATADVFVRTAGRSFHVFATHAQADVEHEAVRTSQIRELAEFIRQTVSPTDKTPWLLGGDLNVIGESDEYDRMMDILGRPVDHWKITGKGDGATWSPGNGWVPKGDEPERLDYLFTGPASHPAICTRIDVTRLKVPPLNNDLSDHYGLEAELEWV